MTRISTCLMLLVLALFAGCGGDDDKEESNREAAYSAPDDGTREVPISDASADDAGPLSAAAGAGGDDELTDEEYDEFTDSVNELASLLDEFWDASFEEEDEDNYEPPADIYGYYPGEDTDVICGGQDAATPENAFYCGETDEIAWDEPGLFLPYYFERGDLAVGIVLAHEWGHLVQNRVGEDFPITYEQELNADCLAGAWLQGMEEEDLLDGAAPGEGGDIDEALETIYSIGDPPDTPFEDPSAHGQPEERLEAVEYGYTEGLDGCIDGYAAGFAEAKGIKIPKSAASATGDSLGG